MFIEYRESVEAILRELTLEDKVAQTLHPFVRPQQSETEICELLDDQTPGGVFVMPGMGQEIARTTELLQRDARLPIVISSYLECGPGRMIKDATPFPVLMSLAATGRLDLARTMGRSAAREGRMVGIHWNFAPVVDINLSPYNPITNVRSFGDKTETVLSFAGEFISGMQESQMAGCAKHFPGDGLDSRDQHICTAVNPLDRDAWFGSYGRIYKELINDGLLSIMIGHVALPFQDPGDSSSISSAPPATLSRRITTDLLRGELGFDGLVISDASVMGGLTSWGPREELIPSMMLAGCDQILFCRFREDFEILLGAVKSGRVPEARIDEAVRRILHFKHRLGLFATTPAHPISDEERAVYRAASREQAEGALTVAANRLGALPLQLKPGDKILSYHLCADSAVTVASIDDLLRQAGVNVTSRNQQERFVPTGALREFDAILIHVVYIPGWSTNRIRLNGEFLRDFIPAVPLHDPRVVFISYGTPYLLNELPRIPALLNAYSPDPLTQQAVADWLMGKIEAHGKSPVSLNLDESWFAFRAPQ